MGWEAVLKRIIPTIAFEETFESMEDKKSCWN